jgi:hypothetical protein
MPCTTVCTYTSGGGGSGQGICYAGKCALAQSGSDAGTCSCNQAGGPGCAPGLTCCGAAGCRDLTGTLDCGACGNNCGNGANCQGQVCHAKYLAQLYDLNGGRYCQGAIMNDHQVVSSCIAPGGSINVVVGGEWGSATSQMVTSIGYAEYPVQNHVMVIIEVSPPFVFNDNVGPVYIDLNHSGLPPYVNTTAARSYGLAAGDPKTLLSDTLGAAYWPGTYGPQWRAASDDLGRCRDGEGDPLIIGYGGNWLIGLTAYGTPNCSVPRLYSNIYYYRDWLLYYQSYGVGAPPPPVCGDGQCNGGETCSTCATDCGACPPPPVCGDGVCQPSENCSSCATDCGACAPNTCYYPDLSQQGMGFSLGGSPALIAEYPGTGLLQHWNGFGWDDVCPAALIGTTRVLTAASCLTDVYSNYQVRFGDGVRSGSNWVTSPLDSYYVHPAWDPTNNQYSADVAVAGIAPITFSANVQPVTLAVPSNGDFAGESVVGVGWGQTNAYADPPDVVQQTQTTVLTNYQCASSEPGGSYCVDDGRICTGDGVRVAGGLLIGGNLLIGIAGLPILDSMGNPQAADPQVFTRVSYYYSWIIIQ